MVEENKTSFSSVIREMEKTVSKQIADAERRAKAAEKRIQTLHERMDRQKATKREIEKERRSRERSLERRVNSLQSNIHTAEALIAELRGKHKHMERRDEALSDRLSILSEDHQASTQLFEQAQLELDKRHKRYKSLARAASEKEEDLLSQVEDTRTELEETAARVTKLAEDLSETEKNLETATGTLEKKQQTVETLRLDLEKKAEAEARREKEHQELHDKCDKQDQALGEKDEAIKALSLEKEEGHREIQKSKEEIAALRNEAGEVRKRSKEAKEELRKSIQQYLAEKSKVKELAAEAQDLKRQLSGLQQDNWALESEMGVLKEELKTTQNDLEKAEDTKNNSREILAGPADRRVPPELHPGEGESSQGKQSPECYLRHEDGEIYGPVSVSEILRWTATCRVGPNHEISRDRKTWHKVKDIRDFEMDWIVPLSDGTDYGPINISAAHILAEVGSVSRDARIKNVRDGKTRKIH
ncbi:MAG: hypothetical protein QGI24_06285 [Kiritimatiellia bacterium]|jgi:DNA repair exonuclease SbcCD ATPase subunit|nr:hypothetical protein [Kiritimatiellia bacterium]MDP6848378.1 hypothetical protein [Kiritimatiellia bacterium]